MPVSYTHLDVYKRQAFTPYGYQKDSDNKNKLVIDAYAAGIVKEIYRMNLSGMSQTAIEMCIRDRFYIRRWIPVSKGSSHNAFWISASARCSK